MKTLEGLNKYAKEIHKGNVERGFYEKPESRAARLMLVTCEIAEAVEADRKGDYCKLELEDYSKVGNDDGFCFELNVKDTFEDEIADAVIRLLDLAAYEGIDLEQHIAMKLKYNSNRPYKHGKNY